MKRIGIIGGSGLEDPDIFRKESEKIVKTPYGQPSSLLIYGQIEGTEVVLLSRHGKRHTIPPTQINNRANIYAMYEAGCTHLLTTTACGSLREEIHRGDIVIPDQIIDFTKHRVSTFFEHFNPGELKHTPMADPFHKDMREVLINTARQLSLSFQPRGTIVTIEGPRFSTRAESRMFRQWGADVINMTIAPEVALANEIGLPYASIAMSTDYDSWRDDEEPVRWEEVLKVFQENVHNVILLIQKAISEI